MVYLAACIIVAFTIVPILSKFFSEIGDRFILAPAQKKLDAYLASPIAPRCDHGVHGEDCFECFPVQTAPKAPVSASVTPKAVDTTPPGAGTVWVVFGLSFVAIILVCVVGR